MQTDYGGSMKDKPEWETVMAKARVLVVDGEAIVRSTVTRSLNLLGYQTDEANSGARAIAMLAQTPYDVMILETLLPGEDSLEIAQRARQVCPDLLIVLLTGYVAEESAVTAKLGASACLRKPTSIYNIAATIADVLQASTARADKEKSRQ